MANIMIVDDSPIIRQRMRLILESLGHRVVAAASDGRQAVDLYDASQVDLITMDMQLPGLSGIEAVRLIRSKNPEAAIIMVSSIEDRSKVFEAIKLGAKHYILKPFTEGRVKEALLSVLGKPEGQAQPRSGKAGSQRKAAGTAQAKRRAEPAMDTDQDAKMGKPGHGNKRGIEASVQANWRDYPIIGELRYEDVIDILPYLSEHEFAHQTTILQQGRASASFHILLSGALDIYVEQKTRVHVAKLSPGSFIGEMSCLTGGAVSASVVADGTVRTVSMPREGLLLFMDKSTTFRRHMIEAMVKRIAESNDRVVEEYTRSFAVLRQLELERQSTYGPLVGDSAFMQALRIKIKQLARQDAPLCIVGENGTGKSHVAYLIHAASERNEFPFLTVQAGDSLREEWDLQARASKGGTIVLEHADQVPPELLDRLMHDLEDTRLIMTARSALDRNVRYLEMVPLRDRKEDIPALIRAVLNDADVPDPDHAIAQEAMNMLLTFPYLGGNIQELKRVVQDALVLSGGRTVRSMHLRFGSVREPGCRPKVGLALGSGSARGAAHVGVLKVLEEADIPVDVIAGTSVGAFIGALYVGGQPISAFERVLPTVRWRQLVQFTLPPKAFVSNHPMTRFVEKFIGPVNFEDLPIPFAAVASDAISGEACILNQGRVSHAICATTAIPGVMKPVKYQDRVLVDGAVVHPVPVMLAKSMGADIVIAVDVSAPSFHKSEPKNFVAAVLNTIDIMSKRMLQDELQLADVVLRPQLDTNQMTFKASADYIRAGENVTREVVTTIQRKMHQLSGAI